MVVDDSISVRKILGRMLEKNGYRVKLAADGLEAAELITQQGCHLVITDLEMPRTTRIDGAIAASPSTTIEKTISRVPSALIVGVTPFSLGPRCTWAEFPVCRQ